MAEWARGDFTTTLMSDHFKNIYRHHAASYERLVAREDYQGNLFAALNEIRPLDDLTVVEFGAGAGRLTRMLSVQVDHIYAFDIEPAMLAQANAMMLDTGMSNWSLALGDNARMPVATGCADLAIEGWSFAHVMLWDLRDWLRQADAMLDEMQRMAKPGGTAILIETMGTGQRWPAAPTPELETLYKYWQQECGFQYRWIRTDYQFASTEEADELIRLFFGDDVAADWLAKERIIVPECTGIWWKHFD